MTAYHNATGNPPPRITQFRIDASLDKERTWHRLLALPMGNGQYRVLVIHPPAQWTAGTVSLRVHAKDAAGNSIDQTVHDAYVLMRTRDAYPRAAAV